MEKIQIGWLFKDQLNLHGDRGNILALDRILKSKGLDYELRGRDSSGIDFSTLDIVLINAGEISRFGYVLERLRPLKEEIMKFIEEGKVLLVTGTSFGLFGEKIRRVDGSIIEGLGIIPVETVEKPDVYGDDIWFTTVYNGKEMEIFGSQIQMADYGLKDDSKAFGTLKYGYGNDGDSIKEGVLLHNSIFTNTLGPVLILNPWLTVEIINTVLTRKGIPLIDPETVDVSLEKESLAIKSDFVGKKVSRMRKIENTQVATTAES